MGDVDPIELEFLKSALQQHLAPTPDQSIQGTIPVMPGRVFGSPITYPKIPLEMFGRLEPAEREKYLEGMRHLPDPHLSAMFDYPSTTRWSNEMIQQHMTPWLDVHKTGLPRQGI